MKSWLNYLFSEYLKNGEFIDCDLSGADELKEDIGDVITKLEPLKDRLTINEYRKIVSLLTDLSLGDVEGGDVLLVNSGVATFDETISPTTTEGEEVGDI